MTELRWSANAMRHKLTRALMTGDEPCQRTKPIVREECAETTVRGFGLVHVIVGGSGGNGINYGGVVNDMTHARMNMPVSP